ncbi:hypothetical protein PybrP1_012208 [[Pythium] brassicae (nom. inval.)]|nr:hypothetical protein PybrP1_012208 [[Pythium] brassicae (nom. inval.)]
MTKKAVKAKKSAEAKKGAASEEGDASGGDDVASKQEGGGQGQCAGATCKTTTPPAKKKKAVTAFMEASATAGDTTLPPSSLPAKKTSQAAPATKSMAPVKKKLVKMKAASTAAPARPAAASDVASDDVATNNVAAPGPAKKISAAKRTSEAAVAAATAGAIAVEADADEQESNRWLAEARTRLAGQAVAVATARLSLEDCTCIRTLRVRTSNTYDIVSDAIHPFSHHHHGRRRLRHHARRVVHVRLDHRRVISEENAVRDAQERRAGVALVEARAEDHVLVPRPVRQSRVREQLALQADELPVSRAELFATGHEDAAALRVEARGVGVEERDRRAQRRGRNAELLGRELCLEATQRLVHHARVRREVERDDRAVREPQRHEPPPPRDRRLGRQVWVCELFKVRHAVHRAVVHAVHATLEVELEVGRDDAQVVVERREVRARAHERHQVVRREHARSRRGRPDLGAPRRRLLCPLLKQRRFRLVAVEPVRWRRLRHVHDQFGDRRCGRRNDHRSKECIHIDVRDRVLGQRRGVVFRVLSAAKQSQRRRAAVRVHGAAHPCVAVVPDQHLLFRLLRAVDRADHVPDRPHAVVHDEVQVQHRDLVVAHVVPICKRKPTLPRNRRLLAAQRREDELGLAVRQRQHRDSRHRVHVLILEIRCAERGREARRERIPGGNRQVVERAALERVLGPPRAVRVRLADAEAVFVRVRVDEHARHAVLLRREHLHAAECTTVAHERDLPLERHVLREQVLEVARAAHVRVHDRRRDVACRRIRQEGRQRVLI